jgi:transposase
MCSCSSKRWQCTGSLAVCIAVCDAKLDALLAPLGQHEVQLAGPTKRAGKNTPGFDLRAALARWAGVDLTRINGLAVTSVLTVLSEIGPDLSRFANVKHFCSWLCLCPGTKISGGKVLSARTRRSTNRVRQALKLAAMSLSRNGSALGAFYRRMCARMDKPRANTAVAHKLARMVYFMLTRGEDYVDQGQQHYVEQQRQRSIAALQRRATVLGFVMTPVSSTA